jgi:hypothetical protein
MKHVSSEPEIRRAAFEYLGRFEFQKKKVRLIGFRISNLEKDE